MAQNETPKVSRDIPYRYVCEHCGTQTEWKTANVTGDTNEAIDTVVLPKAMGEAAKGNYFELSNINGKCHCCGKHQSWELGEAKAWMMRSPLMGLGLGGMIGGVGAFLTVFFFGLLGALIILLFISLVGMIGAFIYGLVRYVSIKSDMKKTSARYIPEIIWYTEQVVNQLPQLNHAAEQALPSAQAQHSQYAPPVGQPCYAPQAQYVEQVRHVEQVQYAPQHQYAAPTGQPYYAAPVGQPVFLPNPRNTFG